MRVAIASRIFDPEPSAASFRLAALARALTEAGHDVDVLTVRPPARIRAVVAQTEATGYRVKRFPVLRDTSGYVRGYLPYLSFDIPLFFRLVFGPKRELVISEPPPTTGFFVRLASWVRRTPYAYYAADIWSDAAAQTDAPEWMVRAVQALERCALRGARVVISVSTGVTQRLSDLTDAHVVTVGNGVDASRFTQALAGSVQFDLDGGYHEFVYAGTASEWHGAEVFVDALPSVLRDVPLTRLRFIGGGSEREALRNRAQDLGVAHAVTFEPVMGAAEIAPILARATAAVASVRPGAGYDFAFPTKLYSAVVCGAPLIYSGFGPAEEFVRTEVEGSALGTAVAPDSVQVAAAMVSAARAVVESSPERMMARRNTVSSWAIQNVGLDAVAERAVRTLGESVGG